MRLVFVTREKEKIMAMAAIFLFWCLIFLYLYLSGKIEKASDLRAFLVLLLAILGILAFGSVLAYRDALDLIVEDNGLTLVKRGFKKYTVRISYQDIVELQRPFKYSLLIKTAHENFRIPNEISFSQTPHEKYQHAFAKLKMNTTNKVICFVRLLIAKKMNRPDIADHFDGEKDAYEIL